MFEMESFQEEALSSENASKLQAQNSRIVGEFKANKLELDAQRNWDVFYKRNGTKFFKNRNWTTREFSELLSEPAVPTIKQKLLEVGCGVGNLIFPLIQMQSNNYFIYACDFSPRAIEHLKSDDLYDETKVLAFQCDITTEDIFEKIEKESIDIITMVFVLSAVHPEKFKFVTKTLYKLLKPGGVILFRDYGLHDMAQLRFQSGNKISDNFYVRQDNTRSYFFSTENVKELFQHAGFDIISNSYVHRRTVNVKEQLDVGRKFVQGKYQKPVIKTDVAEP